MVSPSSPRLTALAASTLIIALTAGASAAPRAGGQAAPAPTPAPAPAPAPAPTPAPDAAAPATPESPATPEPVPAPEPPKPGALIIEADADDLVAEVAGAVHGLKKGDNRVEVAAGACTVVVKTKEGKAVGSYDVQVPAGGELRVAVVSTGAVVIPVQGERTVEIAGKPVAAADGKVTARLPPGKVPVVVREPGKTGLKGEVEVVIGKTATVDPTLEAFDPGNKTAALAGIIGGGALVLLGVLMEGPVDATAIGGDATRWALFGVGTAAFVGGTIWMKDIIAKENSPPVKDGSFDVRLTGGRRSAGAAIAWRF